MPETYATAWTCIFRNLAVTAGQTLLVRGATSSFGQAAVKMAVGGLDPIGDFNPLLRMASGVNLNFFGSFVFGTPGFPLSDVPLHDITKQVAEGLLDARPARVFTFDQIREAHLVMESGQAGGKMVVIVDPE